MPLQEKTLIIEIDGSPCPNLYYKGEIKLQGKDTKMLFTLETSEGDLNAN
jgi:hypothetical protein